MSISNHSRTEILVVDDDAMSRRVLAQLLTAAGYKCRVCKDGSEALEAVHTLPPSLLLLDFDMPGPNGAEVLRRLRSDQRPAIAQIPAIMLTAHGSEESEVSCLQAGADDFVTKPVNAAVLRARIETQLRFRSMRRQLERQNDELEKWRRNLERDLAAARLTQQSLIPQKPPALPGWQVATYYRPVIQVGGDIYGWLRMKDGRILFWIADGTGHGAAAALLTTLAKLLFHHGSVERRDLRRREHLGVALVDLGFELLLALLLFPRIFQHGFDGRAVGVRVVADGFDGVVHGHREHRRRRASSSFDRASWRRN